MQQKEKIRKIIKFQKMMKKLCKDIGVDKATLLSIFSTHSQSNSLPAKISELDVSIAKNESGTKDQIHSNGSI